MAKQSKKQGKARINLQELVVVTYADDIDLAKDFETLLKNNDIPAMLKERHDEESPNKGIAVMVPEDFLDEAHVVVESLEAYDDNYDFDFDDDLDDDLDSEFDDDYF